MREMSRLGWFIIDADRFWGYVRADDLVPWDVASYTGTRSDCCDRVTIDPDYKESQTATCHWQL